MRYIEGLPTVPISDEDPAAVFEVIEKLGEGAYGSVYKCRRLDDNAICAVKVIPIQEHEEDIANEVEILQKCRSDYIIAYYGSYETDGDLWIVMEFMNGGSLTNILDECGGLCEREIAYISIQVLHGLMYMHNNKNIHRDIKAGNILMNDRGQVKLADFGVSASLKNTMSKRNTVIGTPFWMAPEVIQEADYDGRADVWSLGITCIEMADTEPPYFNTHPMRALFMISQKPSPTLAEPEKWSEEFNDFIRICLTKSVEERPFPRDLLNHPFVANAITYTDATQMLLEKQAVALKQLAVNNSTKTRKKSMMTTADQQESPSPRRPASHSPRKESPESPRRERRAVSPAAAPTRSARATPAARAPPTRPVSRSVGGAGAAAARPTRPAPAPAPARPTRGAPAPKAPAARNGRPAAGGVAAAKPGAKKDKGDAWASELWDAINELESGIAGSIASTKARIANTHDEISQIGGGGGGDVKGITIYAEAPGEENIIGEVIVQESTTIREFISMIQAELDCKPGFKLKKKNVPISASQMDHKALEFFRGENDYAVLVWV